MKPIARALREARKAVLQVVLFNSFIDILVVLVLLLLVCTLFTLPMWWALVATLAYAVVHTYGNVREVSFSKIEEKAPLLKEQLITVADNWQEDNAIVSALNEEVLRKMKHIETSSFLDYGKLTRELTVLAVVSFILIGAAAFNVEFLSAKELVEDLQNLRKGPYEVDEALLEIEESQNLSEILGEEKITELGQQQLDLEIHPLKSDVDIGKVNDPEERNFREVPPPEIRASSDVSFEENIPKEYQRIVKTYFKEITRS